MYIIYIYNFLSPLSPQLKELLCERMDAPVPQQCLIFAGKILKEEETLEKQGIKDGVTIHLVVRSSSSTNKVCIPQCFFIVSVVLVNVWKYSVFCALTLYICLIYIVLRRY